MLKDDIGKRFDEGMEEMMERRSALHCLGASGLTLQSSNAATNLVIVGSEMCCLLDRITSIKDRNLQLVEKDAVGRPIDAFEVVVR